MTRRINGFQAPFNRYQIYTWIVFPFIIAQFFGLLFPLMWNVIAQGVLSAIFLTTVILSLVGGYLCCTIDPADNSLIPDAEQIDPESAADELVYCYLCESNVHNTSKHCRFCDKCVVGFDHHCAWLNTCIGSKNYPFFLLIVSSVAIKLTLSMALTLAFLIESFAMSDRIIFFAIATPLPIDGVRALLVISLAALAGIASMVYQLGGFHCLLLARGITTYDFIVETQQKKNKRKQEKEDKKNKGKTGDKESSSSSNDGDNEDQNTSPSTSRKHAQELKEGEEDKDMSEMKISEDAEYYEGDAAGSDGTSLKKKEGGDVLPVAMATGIVTDGEEGIVEARVVSSISTMGISNNNNMNMNMPYMATGYMDGQYPMQQGMPGADNRIDMNGNNPNNMQYQQIPPNNGPNSNGNMSYADIYPPMVVVNGLVARNSSSAGAGGLPGNNQWGGAGAAGSGNNNENSSVVGISAPKLIVAGKPHVRGMDSKGDLIISGMNPAMRGSAPGAMPAPVQGMPGNGGGVVEVQVVDKGEAKKRLLESLQMQQRGQITSSRSLTSTPVAVGVGAGNSRMPGSSVPSSSSATSMGYPVMRYPATAGPVMNMNSSIYPPQAPIPMAPLPSTVNRGGVMSGQGSATVSAGVAAAQMRMPMQMSMQMPLAPVNPSTSIPPGFVRLPPEYLQAFNADEPI